MKSLFPFLLLLVSFAALGQKDIAPTDAFTISGAVEKEMTITLADIASLPSQAIPDVAITNHLGEPRGTAKGLRGVLIKDLLANVSFNAETPKVLSEYFLTFIASDGYTVVFSWNELFNSPTGNSVLVITEKEGKKLSEMNERILILTSSDFKTGRRHIKGLKSIVAVRAKRT